MTGRHFINTNMIVYACDASAGTMQTIAQQVSPLPRSRHLEVSKSVMTNDLGSLIHGYWVSQAVYVAAKLGLADKLAAGPRSVDDLAAETGCHAASLFRLLRALASVGVFREHEPQRFGLSPQAERLRTDAPLSLRAVAIMMGEEHYRAWGELLHSVRTGENAFRHVYGRPVFEFLADHPEQAAIFDAAMTGIHGREIEPMLAAYDFSSFGTLADIGGGNGTVLSALLRHVPSLRGVLFDLPHVVDRARQTMPDDCRARCELVAGDFFRAVPPGADGYLLRHILHDWTDDESATILRCIRSAIPEHGRMLVLESVIPLGNEPFFAKLLDLTMLVIPGGRERTAEEFQTLFATSGFELTRIVPTRTELSLLEARPR